VRISCRHQPLHAYDDKNVRTIIKNAVLHLQFLLLRKYDHEIRSTKAILVENKSTSIQTTSAVKANLAEGQFLLQEHTLDIDNI
jgi:hypothetical protein